MLSYLKAHGTSEIAYRVVALTEVVSFSLVLQWIIEGTLMSAQSKLLRIK